jgi:hypothetical protein
MIQSRARPVALRAKGAVDHNYAGRLRDRPRKNEKPSGSREMKVRELEDKVTGV